MGEVKDWLISTCFTEGNLSAGGRQSLQKAERRRRALHKGNQCWTGQDRVNNLGLNGKGSSGCFPESLFFSSSFCLKSTSVIPWGLDGSVDVLHSCSNSWLPNLSKKLPVCSYSGGTVTACSEKRGWEKFLLRARAGRVVLAAEPSPCLGL